MEFESVNHAIHFSKGADIEIIIVDDLVINVTEFRHIHPGGEESISNFLFQDVTEAYIKIPSHMTTTGFQELKKFTIGKIKKGDDNKKILNDIQETDIPYPIDLNKGTIHQVFNKLNKEQYLAFIHDPKHLINPPESIMFDTPFFELFTKNPWYLIPLIWIPVTIFIIYEAYQYQKLSPLQILICFFVGIFIWTFMEYCLHRFIFHFDDNLPDNRYALIAHYLLHGIHHAFPLDR